MSWISEIANKAETILTTLDSQAATVLKVDKEQYEKLSNVSQHRRSFSDLSTVQVSTSLSNDVLSQNISEYQPSYNNKKTENRIHSRESSFSSNSSYFIIGGTATSVGYENFAPGLSDTASETSPINECVKSEDSFPHVKTEALLKDEICALNQELKSLLKKAKNSENECRKLKKLLDDNFQKQVQTDKSIKGLQENKLELNKVLNEKSEEIKQLENKTVSAVNVQDINSNNLEIIKEQCDIIKNHEADREILLNEMGIYKAKLNKEFYNNNKLKQQVITLENALSSSDSALVDYKHKANTILQSKDNLIQALKNGVDNNFNQEKDLLFNEEFEEIRLERDLLREHNSKLEEKCFTLSNELCDMQLNIQHVSSEAEKKLSDFNDKLNLQSSTITVIKEKLKQAEQGCSQLKFELGNQDEFFSRQLEEKDARIEYFNKQIIENKSESRHALERRIEALTKTLMEKQNICESLLSGKHSLLIQIDRLQQLYEKEREKSDIGTPTRNFKVETRKRPPWYTVESPTDTTVTRYFNKAYGLLDNISLHFEVLMRRYPLSRVLILFYVICLQLWVILILCTHQPEIHAHEFAVKASG